MLQRVEQRIALKDVALLRTAGHVDGRWSEADDGASFEVDDPATGQRIAQVANFGASEAERAIAAAAAALPAWAKKTAKERAAVMRRWFDLMLANADDLALLMTSEQGKPLAEAKGEVVYARVVHRMVRRRGQARRRRDARRRRTRRSGCSCCAAGRRVRGDHAVELPDGDDHAQGRAGARRRLHDRHQAGRADAAVGARAGRARASAPASRRAWSTSCRPTARARSTSAARCARARSCATCRSPARPRSAAS